MTARYAARRITVPPKLDALLRDHAAALPDVSAMARSCGFAGALKAIGVEVPEEDPSGRTGAATRAAAERRKGKVGR